MSDLYLDVAPRGEFSSHGAWVQDLVEMGLLVKVDGPVYRIERAAKVCAPCEELGILNDDHQGFCWWLVEIGDNGG